MWQKAIDLVRGKAGLYPELKSPALYASRGVDMEKLFVDIMKKNGLDRPESLKTTPVIIQSFDEASIRRVAVDLPAGARNLAGRTPPRPASSGWIRASEAFRPPRTHCGRA